MTPAPPFDDVTPLQVRTPDLRQVVKDAGERALAEVGRAQPAPKLPGPVVMALRRARMRWED